MNLKDAKTLADIQEEHSKLLKQLDNKINERIHYFVTCAFIDFKSFFQTEGFGVNEIDNTRITADYKNLSVSLSHDNFNNPYAGILLPLELKFNINKKQTYQINLISEYNGFHIHLSKISTNPLDEARKNLQKTLQRLNQFDEEEWFFIIQDYPEKIKFPTMKALLEKLFNDTH